jgi:hypothetical protein
LTDLLRAESAMDDSRLLDVLRLENRERNRVWRAAHPDAALAKSAAWRGSHPGYYREWYASRRRATK